MFKKKKIETDEQIENGSTPEIPEEEEKPKKKKLPGWFLFLILAVIVLVSWGISALSPKKTASAELSVVKVEKGTIKETYNISGNVESEKQKVFYSPVNAPVQTCNAKVGSAVKAGDLLVVYDVTDLERENQKSELNALSTQYSNQDVIEQNNRSAELAAQSQEQLASNISSLQSKIQEKQNQITELQKVLSEASSQAGDNAAKAAQLQSDLQTNLTLQNTKTAEKETAERDLDNVDTLYPDKTKEEKETIRQELVKTANDRTQEIADLKNAYQEKENELKALGATSSSSEAQALAAAEQELTSLKTSLEELQKSSKSSGNTGLTSGQTGNMQIAENLAELAVLSSEELVAKGKEGIKAEFDGIVSEVKAVEGSAAVQGGELFTLVSNQDVSVKLDVSANDFDKVVVGNKAVITLGQSTYNGTITEVDKIALTNAKGNPVIGAKVHIDNPDENIYIGVTAKVSIVVAEKKDVLYLPNEVVNTGTEGDFVYIVADGVVKKQMVELGVASSSRVEITSGLSKGDQVVKDTLGTVKEGMKATAVQEAASAE